MNGAELVVLAGGASTVGAASWMLRPGSLEDAAFTRLDFGRDLVSSSVEAFVRSLAAERRQAPLVFELSGQAGKVEYRVGATPPVLATLTDRLEAFCPAVTTSPMTRRLPKDGWGWSVRLETANRALRTDQGEVAARSVLSALGRLATKESVTVQWLVGPRLPAVAVPNSVDELPSGSITQHGRQIVGGGRPVDGERRRALRDKVTQPGFRAVARIAVSAGSRSRAKELALAVLGGLRVLEGAGVKMTLVPCSYRRIVQVREPWAWPLRLNVEELAGLLCWPSGDGPFPGLPQARSRLLAASSSVARSGRVVAESRMPGERRTLALSATESLLHTHCLGPTGVGKSTLLLGLICQDMAAGRGVVVIEPKGDLIDDVLARVPRDRLDDVVVLDPTDAERPVGLNPLRVGAAVPELVADQVLAVFHGLYRDNWGPRTQDILHAGLLSLVGRDEACLPMLPVLLTNAAYRRRVIGGLEDRVALGPFWSWYDSISEEQRQQVIAPVMNKLRPFLLRPRLRAVLGQTRPAFALSEVFTERKILLVSLAKGTLGSEAAGLLGSLVFSQLWQATQARSAIEARRRHPVMCFIDEFQDYLHLPTDLSDVLAQARGLGLGLTLAHQHLAQLTPSVRQAVLANARSRVCFQLGSDDAHAVAKTTTRLDAEDFMGLERFEVYASLAAGGQITDFGSGRTIAPPASISDPRVVRRRSRERYGQDRQAVEDQLADAVGQPPDKGGNGIGQRPRRQS